jgi:hypothetical protein
MMLNGDKRTKEWGKYQSTAWVLIKGAWFYDFINRVFYYVVSDRKISLIKSAQLAYDETLKRHHPWILRRTAKIGMLATCSRESFKRNLKMEQEKVTG